MFVCLVVCPSLYHFFFMSVDFAVYIFRSGRLSASLALPFNLRITFSFSYLFVLLFLIFFIPGLTFSSSLVSRLCNFFFFS